MSFPVSVHTCKEYATICLRAYERKCESVELKIFWRSLRAYVRMKIFYRSQHAYVSNEDFCEVITHARENLIKPHFFNSFEPLKILSFIAVFFIGCKVL